jgi:hypothetical protein
MLAWITGGYWYAEALVFDNCGSVNPNIKNNGTRISTRYEYASPLSATRCTFTDIPDVDV